MNNKFKPDWISPPGDTIRELLEEKNVSKDNLSKLLNLPIEKIEKLLDGELEIDFYLAYDLYKVFGPSMNFWLKREKNYRNSLEEKSNGNTS